MFVFGIAFGRLPAPISILWEILLQLVSFFVYLFADAAKLNMCILLCEMFVLGDVGPPFLHDFC